MSRLPVEALVSMSVSKSKQADWSGAGILAVAVYPCMHTHGDGVKVKALESQRTGNRHKCAFRRRASMPTDGPQWQRRTGLPFAIPYTQVPHLGPSNAS